MDFITAGCPIEYLLKDELIHELTIRNLPAETCSSTDTLRKLLRHTCKLAQRRSLKAIEEFTEVDQQAKVAICSPKVADLERNIAEGSAKRLVARSNYQLCRMSRISKPEVSISTLKSSLICILMRLEGDTDSDNEHPDGGSPVVSPVVQAVPIEQLLNQYLNQIT